MAKPQLRLGGIYHRLFPRIPEEASSEVRRALLRDRRIRINTLGSALSTALTLLTFLVTVPITVKYLGPERYGVWMILGSMGSFLALADLGMGYSIQNSVSTADGQNERHRLGTIASSGAATLGITCLILCLISIFLVPMLPIGEYFKVSSPEALREVSPAVTTFLLCFSLSIPLSITLRFQKGLQMGYIASSWQAISALLTLIVVLIAANRQVGLSGLLLASYGTPLLVSLANGITFFRKLPAEEAPTPSKVDKAMALDLLQSGIWFLAVQAAWAFAYSMDNLVITRVLGPASVAGYAIAARVFGMISMGVSLYTHSLWPAYSEAYARGDVDWIRTKLNGTLKRCTSMAAAASLVLGLIAPWAIHIWAGDKVAPTMALSFGFALFVTLDTVRYGLSDFLGALSLLRFQTGLLVVYGVGGLMTKTYAARAYGVEGVIWSGVVVFILLYLLPTAIYMKIKLPQILKPKYAIQESP